ncbi:ClC family H(+)/Cl(-) exchange transporter [Streptococcus australis]|uniref:ClC family H(+)/Cl(-) exchange transporter n=1 Tax=Streptococcus australis TaxID=113107 RepID=UPI001CBC6DDE|nr:ClC family H(+)/Cl(-) exchange transporter [Streptococcus australis]MBZ2154826.1 ClC family H(+)/Cl(-) exchange transporter [Streptococcus australis]MBZ2160182.1 ClC family H(+)/Cl(-) exchange transporter [Streptococcus australis]
MKQSHQIQKEFKSTSRSILSQVSRGALVGLVVGAIVSSFRFFIEHFFHFVQGLYKDLGRSPINWIIILSMYLFIILLASQLIKKNQNVKGSGIPQVEAELKGLLQIDWWTTLWQKYILGILAIASGLMLGREGPSIQLGAMGGKGLSKKLALSPVEERALIASGSAAGLAAAFNAPIAGLLFVVEEVYHHFSRVFWVSTLAASLVANFVSLNVFGQTPVLNMPDHIPHIDLSSYWIFLAMGIFLGLSGYLYEIAVLNIGRVYEKLGNWLHVTPPYRSIFAFLLILPIGFYFPHLLGGGHHLVLDLAHIPLSVQTLFLYFAIRFSWSMISYGSGLPGGIFLPILALGSVLGALVATVLLQFGLIHSNQLPLFVILGMSGYFSAISKAPLTAMILVTEMVGDIRTLMPIGLVTLTAYITMDLVKGAPVYEAMLEQMMPEVTSGSDVLTLIEIPVSEKIAGRQVRDLDLPRDLLITTHQHNGKNSTVHGSTRLYLGDSIFLVVKEADIGRVKELLL